MSDHTPTVPERLARIETLLEGINDKMEKTADLPVRVDRLEQSEKRRSKIIGAAVLAVVGLVVNFFWGLLTGHRP